MMARTGGTGEARMAKNGNDISGNIDFSSYLKELDDREKLASETAENTAVRNYVEWAEHFELLKRSFGQVHSLFKEIGQSVANWSLLEPSNLWGSLWWRDDVGYYFKTGITRTDPSKKSTDKSIRVQFPIMGEKVSGIGDERLVYSEDMKVSSLLGGVDKIKGHGRLTESNSEFLLNKLSCGDLVVDATCNSGYSRFKAQIGIGYLYNHDLADECRQLFMLMNDGGLDQESLDKIFIPGDYHLQSGNIRLQNDDNLIDNDRDDDKNSMWGND